MATYKAEPKILLEIHFGNPDLMDQFDDWFDNVFRLHSSTSIHRDYGRHGRYGYFDVLDAEKVIEWLKGHGVGPR
jgi:hypothetical protein